LVGGKGKKKEEGPPQFDGCPPKNFLRRTKKSLALFCPPGKSGSRKKTLLRLFSAARVKKINL